MDGSTILADAGAFLSTAFLGAMFLHLVSAEDSPGRRVLLKIFARWIELPLLWFIWAACRGPLRFLTSYSWLRRLLGVVATRPFAQYLDTGVPVPAGEVIRLIESLDGPVAVGDCRCRLAKKTCGHPLRTDIVLRTGAEAWLWAFPDNYRPIGKEEAVKIVSDCAGRGMFPMVFIHCSTVNHVNEYVICNCCVCGCKPYLLNRTVGQEYFPLRDGGWRSFHDPEPCQQCGECAAKCPFGAIRLTDNKIEISGCVGCGVCEQVCPNQAYSLRQTHPGPPWAQEAWRNLEAGGK